jgi:hypothetical protein
LSHAYGPAADTPHHLEALRSADAEVRRNAWSDLISSVNHQGDLYPATPWILVPLIDLALDPGYADRVQALGSVALIVEDLGYSYVRSAEELSILTDCRKAAASKEHDIVGLVSDHDPEVRIWALRIVGALARAASDTPRVGGSVDDRDSRVRAVALWQLGISLPGAAAPTQAVAQILEEADDDGLDRLVANALLLSADRENAQAARELMRLSGRVEPEFQGAWLDYVAESPLEFALGIAMVESEIELEALAR